MALTVGSGPFGRTPAGAFNFTYDAPDHVLYLEDSPRRVRVVVADSGRPTLLFETGLPPRFYLRKEDVRMGLLEPTDTETACPYKGTTSRYWTAPPAASGGTGHGRRSRDTPPTGARQLRRPVRARHRHDT
jgi:hypothetical protein